MLAPPPSLLAPLSPTSTTNTKKSPRETSPSTSLDKLYLVSPHPGPKESESMSMSGLGSGSGSGSVSPAYRTTSSAISTNTSVLSPNLLDVQTCDQTLQPDRSATYPPTTLPSRTSPGRPGQGLRRPQSLVGLGLGTETNGTSANVGASGGGGSGFLTRFHPFARSDGHGHSGRPRGGSGPGSGSGSRSGPDLGSGTRPYDTGNQDEPVEAGTGLGMHLDVGSLLGPDSRIPGRTRAQAGYGHTSTFSLHSVGSMDCPSTSGTGTTSEEESICSPGDETPVAGLPLTIIGPSTDVEESGHGETLGGKRAWGETFPRAWGRTLSESSSSGGSDGGGEGGPVAGSSGRKKNARGLRIDVRRTFSVGQQADVKRQEVPVAVPPQSSRGKEIKYATVGRRPMLSISLDPLSPTKQSRQPSHARSLFPLPRSNHVNPEGHARPPYADGPVQVVKGVWIGNEESVEQFDEWVGGTQRGMIVNVAKELEDPYKGQQQEETDRTDIDSVAKSYAATESCPALTYLKLDWTHGETDLASEAPHEQNSSSWGFRKTIERMERARKTGAPILIQ